jgi:hypothetical protein
MLPLYVRALAAELMKFCDDQGRIFVGGRAPWDAIARIARADMGERRLLKQHIPMLIADGYLVQDGQHLIIKNLERAQERRRPGSSGPGRNETGTTEERTDDDLDTSLERIRNEPTTTSTRASNESGTRSETSARNDSTATLAYAGARSVQNREDPSRSEDLSSSWAAPDGGDPEFAEHPAGRDRPLPPAYLEPQAEPEQPRGGSGPSGGELAPTNGPAAAPGPDLLTMATWLAESGSGFGRKMVDWAAEQRSYSPSQKEKIRALYAERVEAQANAERAKAAKAELDAAPATSRSPADAAKAETDAMALWCEFWGKRHGGEAYPVTDRDRGAMRKLMARAQARAKEVGCERFREVLGHYLSRYLAIDDRKLVAERYPLHLLESRMSAIGDYQAAKARAPRRAHEPEPEGTPAPPEAIAALANIRFAAPVARQAGGAS